MKHFIKEHKSEIIVGIICTAATTIIFNGVDWLVRIGPKVSSSIGDMLFNILVCLAASRTHNSIIILLSFTIFGIMIGSLIFPFMDLYKSFKRVRVIEKTLNLLPEDSEELLNKYANENVSKHKKEDTVNVRDVIRKGKKQGKYAVAILIYMFLGYAFFLYSVYVPANLWNTFERDITMIYPYVGEKIIHELESDWVSMRSKEEYLEICTYIDKVKKENSLPN